MAKPRASSARPATAPAPGDGFDCNSDARRTLSTSEDGGNSPNPISQQRMPLEPISEGHGPGSPQKAPARAGRRPNTAQVPGSSARWGETRRSCIPNVMAVLMRSCHPSMSGVFACQQDSSMRPRFTGAAHLAARQRLTLAQPSASLAAPTWTSEFFSGNGAGGGGAGGGGALTQDPQALQTSPSGGLRPSTAPPVSLGGAAAHATWLAGGRPGAVGIRVNLSAIQMINS